jgi:hypothetical protein
VEIRKITIQGQLRQKTKGAPISTTTTKPGMMVRIVIPAMWEAKIGRSRSGWPRGKM